MNRPDEQKRGAVQRGYIRFLAELIRRDFSRRNHSSRMGSKK